MMWHCPEEPLPRVKSIILGYELLKDKNWVFLLSVCILRTQATEVPSHVLLNEVSLIYGLTDIKSSIYGHHLVSRLER